MNELYELREKLCDELKNYGKKEMSAGSLDVVDKLAHAIKNIDKIIDAGGYSHEYSGEMRSYRRGRDSMGRYTSRGYSHDGEIVSELRELMNETSNEQVKHKIKRLVTELESM